MDDLLAILLFILFVYIAFRVFTLPISIAKDKQLPPEKVSGIRILTWGGIFFGILWFFALYKAVSASTYEDSE